MDPFETLGIERRWDVAESVVRDAQRRSAAKWHPDRFRDPADRDTAQRRVAMVNEAAATLLDPLERGRALLEATAPSPRPAEPRPAPMFLAEMLELHEGLSSEDAPTRAAARERARELRQAAESEAAARFEAVKPGDGASWLAAASALATLRATVRALEGWSA